MAVVGYKTFFAVPEESQKPQALVWTNGREYEIDRVSDLRQSSSLKGGGLGDTLHDEGAGKRGLSV